MDANEEQNLRDEQPTRSHARTTTVFRLGVLALAGLLVLGSHSLAFGQSDGFELGGDAEAGEAAYEQYCSSCHGPEGRGKGPAAAALSPAPADFTSRARMAKLSDREIYLAIRDGGAAIGKSPIMPGWKGSLSDDELRDVAAFVRSLSTEK